MIRLIRSLGVCAAALMVATTPVMAAEAYPSGPVRLVVPFAAGGGTDTVARAIAQGLSKRLSQQVVVDNRPGAGGSIGTTAVTQAPADGYTLLLGSNGTMVLNPLLYPALKYKVDRDLLPVGGIAAVPYLIAAHPKFEARDIKGLVDLARAKPGQVTFASAGNGTTNHLVGVLLESQGQVSMIHVPYRGAAPAMNDVVSGQVNFMSGDLGTLLPMVKAGKLRPLALTGKQHVPVLPDVPTVAETLPGFEATGWFGIFAPQGTARAVVDRVSAELAHVLADPEVVQRLQDIGGAPMSMNSDAMKRLLVTETARWQKVIADNKITADALQ